MIQFAQFEIFIYLNIAKSRNKYRGVQIKQASKCKKLNANTDNFKYKSIPDVSQCGRQHAWGTVALPREREP
jgi:hypothetical protein